MVSEGKKIFRIKRPGAYFWTEKTKAKNLFSENTPRAYFRKIPVVKFVSELNAPGVYLHLKKTNVENPFSD